MIIDVAKEKTYIPEWNGNDKLPDEEQIKITYRFLAPGERKKYYGYTISEDYKPIPFADSAGHARAVITKVENLAVRSGGKEVPIKTGAELYNTNGVPWQLTEEVESHLVKADPEVDTDPLQ